MNAATTPRRNRETFATLMRAGMNAEFVRLPAVAASCYMHAAAIAPTRVEETIALSSAWICRERNAGRPSNLEVS